MMPLDMTSMASARPALKPLRDHQQRAIDGIRQSLSAGHRRPMLALPTGAGKTVIAAHVVAGARRKGKRVAFCVPALSLIDQTLSRFAENGIDPIEMGVIQADHAWRRPHAPVQICSAQTLARRSLPEVDVVVLDEAHMRFEVFEKWMADPAWARVPFIGLSATPWSKGLGKHYDDLIKPTSLAELIDLGLLSPFKVYAPSHPDLAGVKTVAGDYHEGQLAERMDRPQLVADVVSTWLEKGNGEPTLCFATGRAHAQHLRDQFEASGVPVAYVDANTPREERDVIGRDLAAGRVKVVCNIGCLTTGVDWDVRCIILARPTKSPILFVQIIGRGLRTADGKAHCTILDHSDTTLRMGFVTDIDAAQDSLDDGKGKKGKAASKDDEERIPLPKECVKCAGLVPAGMAACPCCGHVAKRPVNVDVVDGQLTEMTTSTKRGAKSEPLVDQVKSLPRQVIWAKLLGYCDEKGKDRKWALANFRSLFDCWPKGLADEPQYCDGVVRAHIRNKALRWAKAQAKIQATEADNASF